MVMTDETLETKSKTRDELVMKMNKALDMFSVAQERALLMSGIGMTHEGERDTYKSFGYPKDLAFKDYLNLYERDEMASTIADFIADETWRNEPILIDGDSRTDSDNDEDLTDFLRTWKALNKRLKLITALNNADIYNAISRYSMIFLGAPGQFDQPLTKLSAEGLRYISVHNEGNAKIAQLETTQTDPRYGLPLYYKITFDEDIGEVKVHWSRLIHFKEGNPSSRTYGTPRLKRIFNRLLDWEKVMGGASEAFWLLVNPGWVFTVEDDAEFPVEGTQEFTDLDDQINAFMQNIQRFLKLTGVKAEKFDADLVSAKEQGSMIIKSLSTGSRVPQRVLVGNEAGELASTQDDENLAAYISTRQNKHADDGMLVPVVERFLELGILPQPSNGEYTTEWPSLFQMTDEQKATLAVKVANLINTLSGGLLEQVIDIETFIDIFFPKAKATLLPDMNLNPPEEPTDGQNDNPNNPKKRQ